MKEWRGKQIRGEKTLKPKQPAMCTGTFYQEESLEARNSPKSNKESNCSTDNEYKADRNTHRKALLERVVDSVLQINRAICLDEVFAQSRTDSVCVRYSTANDHFMSIELFEVYRILSQVVRRATAVWEQMTYKPNKTLRKQDSRLSGTRRPAVVAESSQIHWQVALGCSSGSGLAVRGRTCVKSRKKIIR